MCGLEEQWSSPALSWVLAVTSIKFTVSFLGSDVVTRVGDCKYSIAATLPSFVLRVLHAMPDFSMCTNSLGRGLVLAHFFGML
jgi:hypothetical protein